MKLYHINSKVDKPDIKYMQNRAVELMKRGVNLVDLREYYEKFSSAQNEIREIIQREYGIENPNSGQQVIGFLKSLNDLEVYEVCCIDDKWTSNKDALYSLSLLGYDFAEDLLNYRKMKKYAETVKSLMNNISKEDGMIHPKVSLGKTNRINYSDPALMNIPKELTWCLIAPRKEGNILYSVDIKNQEPMILIHVLGIDELKDALKSDEGLYEELFKKPFKQYTKLHVYVTKDEEKRIVPAKEMVKSEVIPPVYYTPIKAVVDCIYYNGEKVELIEVCNSVTRLGEYPLLPDKVAIETKKGNVYKVPVRWEKISDKDLRQTGIIEVKGEVLDLEVRCEGIFRKEFKQAWNAMTYGASRQGVKRICKHINGDIVYDYFTKIPQFKEYRRRCDQLAKKGIQTINTFFGTRLYANESDYNRLKRVLMDLPIQGTGSDILSLLYKRLDTEVERRGLVGKLELYFSRHDEMILEVDRGWFEDVGQEAVEAEIRDILEHQIDDWLPFKIEVNKIEISEFNLDNFEEEDIFE